MIIHNIFPDVTSHVIHNMFCTSDFPLHVSKIFCTYLPAFPCCKQNIPQSAIHSQYYYFSSCEPSEMAFTENKRGNVHITQYCGVFSHNAYTSLAIVTS